MQRITQEAVKEFEQTASLLLPERILDTMMDAGVSAGRTAKREGTYKTAQVTLAFDRTNPKAINFAKNNAGEAIVGITSETRVAIAGTISEALATGIPPAQAARVIRNSIGLTERGAGAMQNAVRRLGSAKPGTLVKLGRKKYRIPEGGLSDDKMDMILERYGTKLLNDRAKLIARTETLAAANEGQRQLWEQAADNGLLTGSELREWIVTPDDRLCEECEEMEGETTGIKDQFTQPSTGMKITNPPLHPDCRCAVGLSDKTEAEPVRPPVPPQSTLPEKSKPVQVPTPKPGSPKPTVNEMLENPTLGRTEYSNEIRNEARDALDEQQKYINNLIGSDRDFEEALLNYTESGYEDMNGLLRSYPQIMEAPESLGAAYTDAMDELVELIDNLDYGIAKAPKVPNLTTYRGIDDISVLGKNLKLDDVIEMNGFQSSSLDLKTAASFAELEEGFGTAPGEIQPILMEIQKTVGMYVDATEDEVIARHATRYKILGTKEIFYDDPFGDLDKVRQVVLVVEQLAR